MNSIRVCGTKSIHGIMADIMMEMLIGASFRRHFLQPFAFVSLFVETERIEPNSICATVDTSVWNSRFVSLLKNQFSTNRVQFLAKHSKQFHDERMKVYIILESNAFDFGKCIFRRIAHYVCSMVWRVSFRSICIHCHRIVEMSHAFMAFWELGFVEPTINANTSFRYWPAWSRQRHVIWLAYSNLCICKTISTPTHPSVELL